MAEFDYRKINNETPLAWMLNYIMLAEGSPTRQVKVGTFSFTASGGSQAITGVGFQPECVIVFGAVAPLGNPREGARMHLGVATAAGEQWALSVSSNDNVSPRQRYRGFASNRLISQVITGAVNFEATFASFDADGFTITKNVVPGVAIPMVYIAMRGGGSYKAGVASKPAGGGAQSISIGFDPDAMLFGSVGRTADGLDAAHIMLGLGAGDGTREHANCMSAESSSVNTSTYVTPSGCVVLHTQSGLTSTLIAKAQVTAMADPVDLDWVTSDGNAYKFGWLALQEAVVDRFAFDPVSSGDFATYTVTTPDAPSGDDPVGFIGFNASTVLSEDDTFTGGAAIGFSGCDEIAASTTLLVGEYSASIHDQDAPVFSVVQTGGALVEGTFGCYDHMSGGLAGTGAGSPIHECNVLGLGDLPQIYRRVR